MEQIVLKNYDYKVDEKMLLNNINFSFTENISLIGTACSGKTVLLKILEEKFGIPRIYKNQLFLASSVEDEIKYLLLNDEQRKLVSNFFVNINLKNNPNKLKNEDKIKLAILKGIFSNNGYVSFDNILTYLKKEDKKYIIDYLKNKKIRFIIVSNDLQDLFLTETTYILNKGSIIAFGPSEKILLEEKLLKRLGFTLPFMIDLSLQLKDYNLIKGIYLDKESLVNCLWK